MHLDKSEATRRIDGLAALINAIAAWIADPNQGEADLRPEGLLIL